MPYRDLRPTDLPRLLELNNDAVPAVGELTMAGLEDLIGMASLVVIAEFDGEVAGFALGLDPGAAYESENYRYFTDHFTDFHYLDRIIVDPSFFRRGIGSELYDEVERRCGRPVLCCEVNLVPRNDRSLAFHERRGFRQVGTQDTAGGKTVSLLRKDLDQGQV